MSDSTKAAATSWSYSRRAREARCNRCGFTLTNHDYAGPVDHDCRPPDRATSVARVPSSPLPLGDWTERGISAMGITQERVTKWLGSCGGCEKRKQALNRLGAYIHRFVAGDQSAAAELIVEIERAETTKSQPQESRALKGHRRRSPTETAPQ